MITFTKEGDIMVFHSENEVYEFIKKLKKIGQGSEGVCYTDGVFTYKFFHEWQTDDFKEDDIFCEEEILRFQDVITPTYLFPTDVIYYNHLVVGYLSKYQKGLALPDLNVFSVSLDSFLQSLPQVIEDTKIVSYLGIEAYDMPYNILFGTAFHIFDTMEYSRNNKDPEFLYRTNMKQFNIGVMDFLIAGLFEDVVHSNPILNEMYSSYAKDASIILFVIEFKNYLSTLVGEEVKNLGMARKLVKRCDTNYQRSVSLDCFYESIC